MECGKVKYPTRQAAIDAIIEISKRDRQSMHAYFCHDCKEFHTATKGKKKRIPTKYQNSKDLKPKLTKKDKNRPKFVPEIQQMPATEKMISKEMAQRLKQLINGSNELEKQKLK